MQPEASCERDYRHNGCHAEGGDFVGDLLSIYQSKEYDPVVETAKVVVIREDLEIGR